MRTSGACTSCWGAACSYYRNNHLHMVAVLSCQVTQTHHHCVCCSANTPCHSFFTVSMCDTHTVHSVHAFVTTYDACLFCPYMTDNRIDNSLYCEHGHMAQYDYLIQQVVTATSLSHYCRVRHFNAVAWKSKCKLAAFTEFNSNLVQWHAFHTFLKLL